MRDEGNKEKNGGSGNVGSRFLLLVAKGQEQRSVEDTMLNVYIKTSYSEEHFIIPDWQPDYHTDFYGRKFYDMADYADFYLCGELCFSDAFEIQGVTTASQQEIEEYVELMELDYDEFIGQVSWPAWSWR